jgi:hypothetical protein
MHSKEPPLLGLDRVANHVISQFFEHGCVIENAGAVHIGDRADLSERTTTNKCSGAPLRRADQGPDAVRLLLVFGSQPIVDGESHCSIVGRMVTAG